MIGERSDVAVNVDRLVVDRGGNTVLRGVSCAISAGTVTGLLGPSGSGKTTLMRAIVGVQQIRSGRVTVLGHPAGARALRSRVGYMAQIPSIYGDLTVRENVRYFARLYPGLNRRDADRTLDDVGLHAEADQLVRTLSGGQFSRASLACAMLCEPDLLVLDEPTVGQDPALREELWRRFHALADQGTTLIVSSHVMDEARRCDRLILLRDGTVIAADTPDGVRAAAGTTDLDAAFLALIRDTGADPGTAGPPQHHR